MKRLMLALLMLSALSAMAQGPSGQIAERLRAQAEAWPREKIYIMPSADEYVPGDIVWLKVYLVDAGDLWNISGSRYVYVELADSSKEVRTRVKLQEKDGLYAGYLRIPEGTGDGIYYLRAYTRYSEAAPGGEALRPIQVGRPRAYVRETDDAAGEDAEGLLHASPMDGGLALTVPQGRYYLVGTCRMKPFFIGSVSAKKPTPVLNPPAGTLHFYALDKDYRVAGRTEVEHTGYQSLLPVAMQLAQAADSCHVLLNMSGLDPDEIADLSISVSRSFHPLGDDIFTALLDSDPEAGLDMTAVFQGRPQDAPRPQEACHVLEGHVETAFRGRPAADAEIRLISPQIGRFAIVRSDASGRFRFEGLDDPEGTEYILNALDASGKENVVPEVDETAFPAFPAIPWRFREVLDTVHVDYGGIDIAETVELEGVVVSAEAPDPKIAVLSSLASFSMDSKQLETIGATHLRDVLLRVPGVFFRSDESGHERCYIRAPSSILGDYPAAFAVDGIIMDGVFDLDFIEMTNIERVDVFKGGQTVIWGARGGSGVVSITTKSGNGLPSATGDRFNIRKIYPLGYQRPVRFRPDARTLYWNPSIRSNRISFPLEGKKGEWRVQLQGVTSKGRIINETVPLVIK